MDELRILGDVGEGVDPGLVDQDPVGDSDLASDLGLDVFDAGDGHGGGLERPATPRLKPREEMTWRTLRQPRVPN